MQPEFYCNGVDGKANPKCDAEELPRFKVGQSTGSEKNAHHRPRCSDAEQYSNGPRHPTAFQQVLAAAHISEGTRQRKQEHSIEEKHFRALYLSANCIGVHGIGGNTDYCSQRKQQLFCPYCFGTAEKDK